VTLAVPRDRNGEFDPKIVPKGARRLAGFNERILSLYARGMSVRDIRSHLAAIYGVEVSPDLISTVTDAVVDELAAWQNRPPPRPSRPPTHYQEHSHPQSQIAPACHRHPHRRGRRGFLRT
jgi:transposase-like protein